jgi:predicted O-linked N-acetylglucosamine transferase (SPINDLY family)
MSLSQSRAEGIGSGEQPSPAEIVRQCFDFAAQQHRAGQLAEAELVYRQILLFDPCHADALHGLGVIAHQVGRDDLAADWIGQALAQRQEPTFHNNLGLVLLALGRPHQALAAIRSALERRPAYPEAFNALGNAQELLGTRDEAILSYEKALRLRPGYAEAHVNLGKARQERGDFDLAKACYERALAFNPYCAEALNNLGNLLRVRGALDEALRSLDRALACKPNYAEAYNNKGVVLLMKQEVEPALVAFRCALAINPEFPAALASYGSALVAQGKFDDSLDFFRRAIALDPNCVQAYNNLGATLLQLNTLDEAIEAFERAIELSQGDAKAEAHYNLGTTLLQRHQIERAMVSLGKALEADPSHAGARNNFGVALQDKGQVEEAVAAYGQVMAATPEYAGAYSNKLMAMHYIETYTNDDVLKVALAFGTTFDRPDPRPFFGRDLSPERRLRIGYVSGDFNVHPVAFFLASSLEAHNREKFEIFCYSNWLHEDELTAQLRAHGDQWRVIVGASDEDAAQKIRDDEIDILVDLAGHTNKTRVNLFGLKPAPVQAAWLGYFGTTGLKSMDYLVLDPVSAPPGADKWYTESLVRLPYGRFCFKPPPVTLTPASPPCLVKGFVTFGCFNNVAKLSPGAIRLWAEILKALPQSRLVLKWRSLSESSVRKRLLDAFAKVGVEAGRIEMRGASPYIDMLSEYGDIDIALDPFPFGGATTSCEALWMGVPVITLPGERLASRQTLGFLDPMGFSEFAASSREDYAARALALAADPERLGDLRRRLRPAMEGAPFCDGPKFTATLEAAYRRMWRRHVAGEKAEPFHIAPDEQV